MPMGRSFKSFLKGLGVGGVIVVVLLIGVAVVAVVPYLVQAVWGWVIPDLFPGAVKQGLMAGTISWFTALKLTILLIVFGMFGASHSSSRAN